MLLGRERKRRDGKTTDARSGKVDVRTFALVEAKRVRGVIWVRGVVDLDLSCPNFDAQGVCVL